MAHPKDNEIFPIETVVSLIKTGEFAIIKKQVFLKDEKNFLHYLAKIEGRDHGKEDKAYYVIYHHEIRLEALPPENKTLVEEIIYLGLIPVRLHSQYEVIR